MKLWNKIKNIWNLNEWMVLMLLWQKLASDWRNSSIFRSFLFNFLNPQLRLSFLWSLPLSANYRFLFYFFYNINDLSFERYGPVTIATHNRKKFIKSKRQNDIQKKQVLLVGIMGLKLEAYLLPWLMNGFKNFSWMKNNQFQIYY
jgi:hypothetical protein